MQKQTLDDSDDSVGIMVQLTFESKFEAAVSEAQIKFADAASLFPGHIKSESKKICVLERSVRAGWQSRDVVRVQKLSRSRSQFLAWGTFVSCRLALIGQIGWRFGLGVRLQAVGLH